MAKIPIYTSSKNIVATTPEPLRQEAAAEFAPVQQITEAIKTTTQAWSDANDVMQKTDAIARQSINKAKTEAAAANDSGITQDDEGNLIFTDNTDKYIAELEASKALALGGISNKSVSQQVAAQFDMDLQIARIKISSDFKTKQVAYNKDRVVETLSGMQREINTSSGPLKQERIEARDALLAQNVATGTLTLAEARKMKTTAETDSVKYDIYADPATDEKSSQVLADIKDRGGKYKYLDEGQRLDLIKESQRRIFQNNQSYKRQLDTSKDVRMQNVYDKINKGTLRIADLDAEMAVPESEGGLPPKVLKSLYDGYATRTKDALQVIVNNNDKALDYLKYIDKYISDDADKLKAREILATAYKDHVLSNDEGVILDKIKSEAQKIESTKNMNMFKSHYRGVREYFLGVKTATNSEVAAGIKNLVSKIGREEDISKAAEEIIYQDKIKRNPAITLIAAGNVGVPFMDITGIVKKVFNDGHTEEMK